MAIGRPLNRDQRGQATPEYVAVILLVATTFGAVLALAGPLLPGGDVARAVASKLVCAVKIAGRCGEPASALAAQPRPLQRAYGAEVAAMLATRVPRVSFEDDDFVSLPVDYRECRERACADSILHGSLEHTQTGLPPTAFTHVVDCSDPAAATAAGQDCSDAPPGAIYLQYWLYYPESLTHGLGMLGGFHEDDWESYQVRIDSTGTAVARASSHHGYNGREGGIASIGSDTGEFDAHAAWDTVLNQLHVAAGSHAGMTEAGTGDSRHIETGNLELLPLEPIVRAGDAPPFAITPPWEKDVWTNPEAMGT
ncbi:MAG: hypothetical protein ABIZ50_00495 [Solirubrobacterales bacterium]